MEPSARRIDVHHHLISPAFSPRGGLPFAVIMLRCMSLLLARSCRAYRLRSCPLLGVLLPRWVDGGEAVDDP